MYNQIPFYSPPHSNIITFLPYALESGCTTAVLREGLFCTKCIIGKRVQVDGALQGEGLSLLDALVELVDTGPPPQAPTLGPAGLSDWVAPRTCWRAWMLAVS